MIRPLLKAVDAIWGRGEFSVTVPSMDGALRPNTRLDEAEPLVELDQVDNLAAGAGGVVYCSSGRTLFAWRPGAAAPAPVADYPSSISALAADGQGQVAIGLDTGGLLLRAEAGGAERALPAPSGIGLLSPTALAFDRSGLLHACLGSASLPASAWKRDLMLRGSSGSVWAFGAQPECLGRDLAFPYGLAFDADGAPVVSEAWRCRLIRRSGGGWQPLLSDLPGYPARLAPASDGGFWLSVFARRSQMIEFVLREKSYRERMVREIDEQFWMAPTLRAGRSFKEPLQGGGVKHLGIDKPWGPTRSYGLLVRLDRRFQPVQSFHSRADGHRHGITSSLESGGRLLVAARGDGVIVSPRIEEEA